MSLITHSSHLITQEIVNQTDLTLEHIQDRIQQLSISFHYPADENDSTLSMLLAQELNVDLGDPSRYLYSELIFDHGPLFVRIIPFVTIDKDHIKATLREE